MSVRRWRRRGVRLVSLVLLAAGCAGSTQQESEQVERRWTIAGATMGTTFRVTVVSGAGGGRVHSPPAAAPSDDGLRQSTLDTGRLRRRAGSRRSSDDGLRQSTRDAPAAAPPIAGAAISDDGLRQSTLETEVRRVLERIEGRMSHYRSDSELSRFNRTRTIAPQPLSGETLQVVAEALAVSRASGGAFDVTVGPLVDAWGFGPPGRPLGAPDAAGLAALRARVGSDLLEVDLVASTLRKRRPDVVVDLSAIAKGYAVDAVAALLAERGSGDYLVEIGGELRAGGSNERGEPWRIAIEHPVAGAPSGRRIVPLTDAAVATSGDYRNYYDLDGVRVSHTIDPRTGRPVTHRLLSVSVIAERCSLADARSTALNVLGPDEGYALAAAQGWAALFVSDDRTGRIVERETPAFTAAARGGGAAPAMVQ